MCDGLHLALVATHLRVVWHARVITGERAMHLLDQAAQARSGIPPAAS